MRFLTLKGISALAFVLINLLTVSQTKPEGFFKHQTKYLGLVYVALVHPSPGN